jgi:carbon monoxide dehydrogenase subunit G
MEMKGEQMIAAPRERVWAALNDADILRQSIEGCESLEKTSDTSFVARVVARIGPVKAGFGGNITLTDIDAPNGYTLVGEGSGAGAGFAKGVAKVRLSDEGGSTRLSYEVQADVGGKLAQIGSRLIDGAAKKQADSFFSRFGALVSGGANAAPGRAPAIVAAPATSGPGWISAVIMIVMALIIGFLAGKIWG